MKKSKTQEQKRYQPSKDIVDFLDLKLQLLKNGEYSRKWDAQKVRKLDKIFQEMADLLYFLETIANNPKLQEVFEDDLEDLFDIRPNSKTKQLHHSFGVDEGITLQDTTFTRLIFASIMPHEYNYRNFRLRLTNTLQEIIYVKMELIFRNEYGIYNQISQSALEDLRKSVGWVNIFSGIEQYEKEEPNRVLDFSVEYS